VTPDGGQAPSSGASDPLSLVEYFRCLDDWANGRPVADSWVVGIVAERGFAERERTEWLAGRDRMWKLLPPIDESTLDEEDLDPASLLALALAVVVWARHGMAWFGTGGDARRLPEVLNAAERLGRAIAERFEAAGRRATAGGIVQLAQVRAELQELRMQLSARGAQDRGVPGPDIVSARMPAIGAGAAGKSWLRRGAERLGIQPVRPRPPLSGQGREDEAGALSRGLRRLLTWPGSAGAESQSDVDPQVPEPPGLYAYIQALEQWSSGKPPELTFAQGLIQIVGYGDLEREEFQAGRRGLWPLVPPIDPTAVADAQLPPESGRAFALAVRLWGTHALHRYVARPGRTPPALQEVAEMVNLLRRGLDVGGTPDGSAARRSLEELAQALEQRGAASVSAIDERRAAIREQIEGERAERAERAAADEAAGAAEATHGSGPRLRFSTSELDTRRLRAPAMVLVLLAISWWLIPSSNSDLPPASNYAEIPTIAVIRHADEVTVRARSEWLALPLAQREEGAVALWNRFVGELGGVPIRLTIADEKHRSVAWVANGRVKWESTAESGGGAGTASPAGAAAGGGGGGPGSAEGAAAGAR
jgi:hypothetical protein